MDCMCAMIGLQQIVSGSNSPVEPSGQGKINGKVSETIGTVMMWKAYGKHRSRQNYIGQT